MAKILEKRRLTPITQLYKVDAPYDATADGSVRFDDPQIGIDWSIIEGEPTLSEKDAAAPLITDWESPFVYGET